MSKKEFFLDILKDRGPVIPVKLTSTYKNAGIDFYNNIPEKYIIVNALIDTGAPNSLIDESILKENIQLEQTRFNYRPLLIHLTTVDRPVYKVGLDLLMDDQPEDTFVGLIDLSGFKIPGDAIKMLIGRDILSRCIFSYNGVENSFTLELKS